MLICVRHVCRIKEAENGQLASGMQLTQADRAAAQEAAQRIQTKLEGEVQRLQDQLKELERSSRSFHPLGFESKTKKSLILNLDLGLRQGRIKPSDWSCNSLTTVHAHTHCVLRSASCCCCMDDSLMQ